MHESSETPGLRTGRVHPGRGIQRAGWRRDRKGHLSLIGAAGTAAIRTGLAAIILLALFRPRVHRFTAAQWRAVVPYGITIGVMNLLFYQALVRIPLGLTVALEFVGPLALAIFGSRRALDVVWVVLAMTGIALIAPFEADGAIDPVGVIFALLTGACWAAYIVLGGRVSQRMDGGVAVAVGMTIAAVTIMPVRPCGRRDGEVRPSPARSVRRDGGTFECAAIRAGDEGPAPVAKPDIQRPDEPGAGHRCALWARCCLAST